MKYFFKIFYFQKLNLLSSTVVLNIIKMLAIEVNRARKDYGSGDNCIAVLQGLNLKMKANSMQVLVLIINILLLIDVQKELLVFNIMTFTFGLGSLIKNLRTYIDFSSLNFFFSVENKMKLYLRNALSSELTLCKQFYDMRLYQRYFLSSLSFQECKCISRTGMLLYIYFIF